MNYLELFESFNVNINESHGISPLVEYLLPYYMKSINKLNKNNLYIDFIDFLKETEEKGIDYSFYKKYFIEIPFEIIEKGFNQFYKEKKNFKLNKEKHKFATFLFINDPKCGAGLYKNEFLEINQNENDNKILFLIGVNYYHLNADSDDIMSKIKCNIDDILSHEIKHMIDSIFYDNPLEKIKTYNNYNDNDIYLLDPEENKARISEYCNGIKKIKDINMIADILKILYKIKNIKYDDFIEQRYEISDKIEKFEDDIFKYYKKFPSILNLKHILKLYYSCNTLLFRPYKDLKYILKSKRRNNKKVVERILKIEGKFINNLIKITYDRYVELNNNSSNKKINESFTSKVIKDKKGIKQEDKRKDLYNFVDLGLPSGTLWCKHNYGAKEEYEYGEYLNFYDALNINSIGNLPSKEDFIELDNYCKHKWTKINNIRGLLFTSTINKKSIFFPAAGIFINLEMDEPHRLGKNGLYWSSDEFSNNKSYAMAFIRDFSSLYFDPSSCTDCMIKISVRLLLKKYN